MNELKQQLLNICNESKLPLEAIYFIVKDLYRDVEDTFNNALLQQKKEKEEIKENDD